jgi:hypothetical protein
LLLGTAVPGAAEPDHTTYVVRVPTTDRATIAAIEGAGGVIDHYDGHGTRAYILHTHWAAFLATGVPHRVETVQPPANKQVFTYPDFATITAYLNTLATNYPGLCRLTSIGTSVQGRDLYAIQITDNPGVEEAEPEFAYFSTMHGDETVGTVLCLNFIEMLLEGYGQNTEITELIDETEIWILPLINPDGYELGIRWNANNADLNRGFPQWPLHFTGTVATEGLPDTRTLQPEVARIVEWSLGQSLVLTANYHTGALVVNYPYDEIPDVPSGADAPTPDDALMEFISNEYASRNPPMYSSPSFPGGITNGSAWYRASGTMQDWHYRFAGAIDLTLEVSNIKDPAQSTLPQFWLDNRDAMLALAQRVHRGIRGEVVDAATGTPLFATVTVDDNPQPVFTDADVGDFYRLLLPGTYAVRAEAEGYIPYTHSGVAVTTSAASVRTFPLSQGDVNGDGATNATDLQLVLNTLLGRADIPEADLDGQGVSATDLQHLVNRILLRP